VTNHCGGAAALKTGFGAFSDAESAYLTSPGYADDGRFWSEELTAWPTNFSALPFDARPQAIRREISVGAPYLAKIAKQQKVTPFVVLLTALNLAMQGNDLAKHGVIGVPVLNREWLERPGDIGQITNILPLRPASAPEWTASAALETRERLSQIQRHGRYALLELGCGDLTCPPIALSVNLEPGNFEFPPQLGATLFFGDRPCTEFPVEMNIVKTGEAYRIMIDIGRAAITEPMIDALLTQFDALLKHMEAHHD
jgi:hypothetical protein